MNNNYNNLTENIQAKPYLYAVINLGHSAISGMLAYKEGACIVPICLKSYSSIGVFHHGLLKNATAFREIISRLLNDFNVEINRRFKNGVELVKLYIGIAPVSMQLINWTYSREEETPQVITKGILSKLNEDCLNDFLKSQSEKRENSLTHIASLSPVYYVDKDFETPCTSASIDKLTKKSIMVKQQMLCVKEKYIKAIQEQILSINNSRELEIKFLANPLVEAKQWEEQECQDYVYVNLGAGSSSIFMTDKGYFYKMFIYPFGANSITNDIQKYFSISTELAEHFKVNYSQLDSIEIDGTIETAFKQKEIVWNGKNYSMSNLNKLVFVRMREILTNIKTYVEKIYRSSLPNKIIFYGGGTKLVGFENLVKYLEFDFCDVEIIPDLEFKVNQTLSNIHQISWNREELSNEQIFTLISLVNYISSMDNYLNEEQGYSVHINQAMSVEADLEYQAPIRRRPRKASPAVDSQSVVQEEIFANRSESSTTSEEEKEEVITSPEEASSDIFRGKDIESSENDTSKADDMFQGELITENESPEEEVSEDVISSDDILGNYF